MKLVKDSIKTARMVEANESDVKNAQHAMRELSLKGKDLQAQLRLAFSRILSEEQFLKFNQFQEARRKQAARRANFK